MTDRYDVNDIQARMSSPEYNAGCERQEAAARAAEELSLLREIRNGIRFLVDKQLGGFHVESECGVSFEEQVRQRSEISERVMRTGSHFFFTGDKG